MDLKSILARAAQSQLFDAVSVDRADNEEVRGTLVKSGAKNYKIVDKEGRPYNTASAFIKFVTGEEPATAHVQDKLFLHHKSSGLRQSVRMWATSKTLQSSPQLMSNCERLLCEHIADKNVKNLADFHSSLHDGSLPAQPKHLYRVLRLPGQGNGEDVAQGLNASGKVAIDPASFGMGIYKHVANGHTNAVQPNDMGLISTTKSILVAAWYSHCFTKPVARITVQYVGNRIWDPLSLGPFFKSYAPYEVYALRSAELLIENKVKPEAVQIYYPVVESRRVAVMPGAESTMPESLNKLIPVSQLGGTTDPIKVRTKDGITFVMKHGRGTSVPSRNTRCCGSGQTCAEFFSLVMYRIANARVPDAALYRVRITDGDDPTVSILSYVLLTKFLEGASPWSNLRSKDMLLEFRKHVWLDLALRNFDVCGHGYSNVLQFRVNKETLLYRVDAGCNVSYTAEGVPLHRVPIDDVEINAFFDQADHKQSQGLCSTMSAKTAGRKSDSAGKARVSLLRKDDAIYGLSSVILSTFWKDLHKWAWGQIEIQALWMDMIDDVLGRAESLHDHFKIRSLPSSINRKLDFDNSETAKKSTDMPTLESEFRKLDVASKLQMSCERHNLLVDPTPRDGACQFHAIAQSLKLSTSTMDAQERQVISSNVRRQVVIRLHTWRKEEIVTEEQFAANGLGTADEYLKKMGESTTWGDELTLTAASVEFKCHIQYVSTQFTDCKHLDVSDKMWGNLLESSENFPTITLAHELENHWTATTTKPE